MQVSPSGVVTKNFKVMKRILIALTLLSSAFAASSAFAVSSAFAASAAYHYAGGDVSLLPDYEKAGAVYKDYENKTIPDLLPFLADNGMNAMRVRVFVNPDRWLAEKPGADPNACQDIDYIIPLCRRIKECGMSLMLDFHYSDTWADPAAQWTPLDWQSLTDEQLTERIAAYTRETLTRLQAEGVTPDFIQPGNEISYGMLWGPQGGSDPLKVLPGSNANWSRFTKLLNSAITACRDVCPDAKIVIHSERTGHDSVLREFFNYLKAFKVDYDIIGLSYYPYFHCPLSGLDSSLTMLEEKFPDHDIMIVETGFPYKWEVPGTTQKVEYPYTEEGQAEFARDLVALLEKHPNVNGLFWWWLEYNAYGTQLSGWYNAPLFNSLNGKACPALREIGSFTAGNDASITEVAPSAPAEHWYRLDGTPVTAPTRPGFYVSSTGRKQILR